MSISQLKKAAAELKSYLNNDKKGQELMAKLLAEVHELKASNATNADSAGRAKIVKDHALSSLGVCEIQLSDAKREVIQLNQKINSQSRHLRGVEAELAKFRDEKHIPFCTGDIFKDLTNRRVARWANKTIREVGSLPKMKRLVFGREVGFFLPGTLPSFDDFGFATLGRVAFLSTVAFGRVSIEFDENVSGGDILKSLEGEPGFEATRKVMLQLFTRSLHGGSDSDRLSNLTSGKCLYPSCENAEDTTAFIFGG